MLFCLFAMTVNAQVGISKSYSKPNSKWVYGGSGGLGFTGGSGLTIYGTANLGYKISNDLVGGIDGSLSWQKYDYSRSIISGIGPFLNYYIGRTFYTSANYRHYFISQKLNGGGKYSLDEGALNLGAGYLQSLGANAYLRIGASYNVLYKKDKSIMRSPFTPYVGVVFGL